MGFSSLNPFGSSSSSSTPSPTSPKPSSDGAFIAPDRTSRAKCYEARDAFFQCLDKNGVLDAIKEEDKASKQCGDVEMVFGRECAASWVSLFSHVRYFWGICEAGEIKGGWKRQSEMEEDSEVTYFKQRRVMEWKKQQTLSKIEAEGGWVPAGGATPAASQPQMPK
ncbi:MAG: hypothetical protein Q9169_000791 [Polycauliona sp. 2 TL-2023]